MTQIKKILIVCVLLLIAVCSAAIISEYFKVSNTVNVEGTLNLCMHSGAWGNIQPGENVTDTFDVENVQDEVITALVITEITHMNKTLTDWAGLTVEYTSNYIMFNEQEPGLHIAEFRTRSVEYPFGYTTVTRSLRTDTNLQPGRYCVTTRVIPFP